MTKNIGRYCALCNLMLFVWTVNSNPATDTSKVQVSVSTDVDFRCRLFENSRVSDISSVQIAKSRSDHTDFMIIATAVAKASYITPTGLSSFPEATASGSIDEGWLLLQIPNITRNALGIYRCAVYRHDNKLLTQIELTERLLSLAQKSVGVLYSHPPGFEISVIKKVSVICSYGCLCNQTIRVNFPVYGPMDSANQPYMNCGPTDQENRKCWISAACGKPKMRVDLSCTGLAKFSDTFECIQTEKNICPDDNYAKPTYYMTAANTVFLWVLLPVLFIGWFVYHRHHANNTDSTKARNDNEEEENHEEDPGPESQLHRDIQNVLSVHDS
ncbi:hypothetical protein V1264_002670 [Littorina saxatilis]|uniref:Uncharacterized protein n=1 Tax=Littorina saxatilis TaxID=31220 RepID=A0AAN9B3R4_9CAEN